MSDSSLPSDDKQEKTIEVNTAANITYNINYAESVHAGAGDINPAKGIGMSLLWLTTPNLNDRIFFVDCKLPHKFEENVRQIFCKVF